VVVSTQHHPISSKSSNLEEATFFGGNGLLNQQIFNHFLGNKNSTISSWWFNPFEKYARQNGNLPQFLE